MRSRLRPRNLFLLCFAVLFLEMASIRWLNSAIQVLSFFNNLILISSFFGLGAGCLLANRRVNLIRAVGPVFLVEVGVVLFLGSVGISISYDSDLLLSDNYGDGKLLVPFSAVLSFLVNTGFYVCLGQELGKQFQALGNPLRAYAYDLAGSLLGTLAYALLAYLQTPPVVWFAVGLLLLAPMVGDDGRTRLPNLLCALVALGLVGTNASQSLWSPYYKIDVRNFSDTHLRPLGYFVKVDNVRIQDALDFTRPELLESPLAPFIPYYWFPYRLAQPKKVLLLGAGGGNEVVACQQNGVEHVDAVEIDPIIAQLGFIRHPCHPYRWPGVQVHIDDARAYLSSSSEQYDLITLSALDSHKQIAGMSSLRLESFVFTVDAFRQMRKRLKPHGALCVHRTSTRSVLDERLYWSLTAAFGKEPQVLVTDPTPYASVAYWLFNDDTRLGPEELKACAVQQLPGYDQRPGVLLCTDDWPYLYLEDARIPGMQLYVLLLMVLGSTALVMAVDPRSRRPNGHFYLLGAGFMLLETRSITQLSLLFGATWSVNVVVVASVLLAVACTNQLVLRGRGASTAWSYPILGASLILGYLFPFRLLLDLTPALRLLSAGVVVGFPIVWASFIFSNSFQRSEEPERALGSNLLGVVLGGALEYASVVLGLRALYLAALGLYFGSWLCWRADRR